MLIVYLTNSSLPLLFSSGYFNGAQFFNNDPRTDRDNAAGDMYIILLAVWSTNPHSDYCNGKYCTHENSEGLSSATNPNPKG